MPKDLHISDLFDYYGSLLTAKQQRFLKGYYFDDLSLSEIAENEGGTRQGISEVIKRAEDELIKMENDLNLFEKSKKYKDIINDIRQCLKENDIQKANLLLTVLEKLI